jgi:autotransporter-associated beta strand protein
MQAKNGVRIGWVGLALVVAMTLGSAGTAQAGTYVWTNTASANWSDTNSWYGGAVPSTSGGDVRFNAIGAGGVTATMDSGWSTAGSVNSLTFLPGAQTIANNGTLTLANGAGVTSFTIGTGGIYDQNGRNQVAFASPVTLSGDQTWTFVRPVLSTASLKTPANYQPTLQFSGAVNGSAANTVLTLNGDPAWSQGNQALGANVLLTGASGALGANIGRLNLKGSFVQLGASAADANFNRIADNTTIASYGGGLYVFRQGNGTETFGDLRLENGAFSVLGNASGSGTTVYKFASLAARNNEAVLRLSSGTGTGNQINYQFADVSGFGAGINGIVGGWAVGLTQQGGTRFLAPPTANTTMTTVTGVDAANTAALNVRLPTDNVNLTGTAALTGNLEINSLRSTSNYTLDLAGYRLRIRSGGVIDDSASSGLTIWPSVANSTITAGNGDNTPGTLYFHSRFAGSPITFRENNYVDITDNGSGQVNVIYASDSGLQDNMGRDGWLNYSYTGFTGIYGAMFNSFGGGTNPGDKSPFGLVPASFVADKIRISGGGMYANGQLIVHANQGIQLAGAGLTVKFRSVNLTINSAISGEGQVNLAQGTLYLQGTSANTYTGATVVAQGLLTAAPALLVLNKSAGVVAVPGDLFISANDGATVDGTVQLSAANQIADTSVVTLARPAETGAGTGKARLRLNGNNETIAGLMGSAGASANLIVENNHASTACTLTLKPGVGAVYQYDGIIQNRDGGGGGALNLVINGNATGTQILNGANTYSGTTTVSGGTLALGAADRLPDAPKLILAGGTLATRGFGETLGALAVSSGASVLDFGSGSSVVTFADSSAETWTGTLTLLNYTSTPSGGGPDRLFIGSSASLSAAQLAKISDAQGRRVRQLANGEIVVIPMGTVVTIR